MGRHADAAVFGKNTGLKTSLRFARAAGAIGVSIAVMVDLREILLFWRSASASCHDAAMIAVLQQ